MLHYGASDGVDPVLFLLLGISDEVHRLSPRTQLKSVLFIQHIFGSLDGEAGGHWNNATWLGGAGDSRFFEPKELALF